MLSEQVGPPGSILWMGSLDASAAALPLVRLGRALCSCLPHAHGARRARGGFLSVEPPCRPRDALPCLSYAPWRATVPCLSRALRRTTAPSITDPSFESAAASALVAELLDFAAACRLDHASALVAESVTTSPTSVEGECALGTDILEDRQEDFECLAAAVPHLVAMLLASEGDPDAPDIPTPRSYAEAITAPYSTQWVRRPPGSPPAFKAPYVARGFSQRQGVDYFQTFSPTSKMTTLRVLLHVAAQRDYELHSLDFSTAFLQGCLHEEILLRRPPGFTESFPAGTQHDYELRSLDFSTAFLQGGLHEEMWLRRPPGFTGTFPAGTQWSLRRPVYGLRQAPREWHDTLKTTLAALGFAPSTADPSLFLRTDTLLPPFYVLVYVNDLVFATADTEALTPLKSELQKRHTCTDQGELRSYLGLQITRDRARRTITLTQSHMVHQVLQRFGFQFSSPQLTPLSTSHSLSAPPSDESVEPSGPYLELVGCLMYLMTCSRPDLAYPLSLLACYVAPGSHRKVHWDAAKRVLRYPCSTSSMGLVLGGRGPLVLTGHADASWRSTGDSRLILGKGYRYVVLGGYGRTDPLLNKPFYPNGLVVGYLTWYLCEGLRFEPQCVHLGHPSAGGCQRSIGDPRLILGKGYRHVVLGGYGRTDPLLNKPFYPNGATLAHLLADRLGRAASFASSSQRGQLRLAYVATRANTADVFTKALPPGDHQRFATVLGLVPTLPHLLTA
ncbi:unnamed protein product [Closterium sp. NIES-54]